MISIEQTFDVPFIHRVMSHPAIFPMVTDDSAESITPETVKAILDTRGEFMFFRVRDVGDDMGLFMYQKHSAAHYEIHTCILPEYRGPKAYEAGHAIVAWLWANTCAGVISTYVPERDRAVRLFAKAIGFKEIGILPASLLRNRQYLNQTLLALERTQSCQSSSR